MPVWEIVLGALVFILSVTCNAILNLQGGAMQWTSSRLGVLSFLLFMATLYLGYRWYGWLGGAGALVAQLVGMLLLAPALKNRVGPRPPQS
jgi:peptidoglycan/LPS O-acetylase OafA/YrhL